MSKVVTAVPINREKVSPRAIVGQNSNEFDVRNTLRRHPLEHPRVERQLLERLRMADRTSISCVAGFRRALNNSTVESLVEGNYFGRSLAESRLECLPVMNAGFDNFIPQRKVRVLGCCVIRDDIRGDLDAPLFARPVLCLCDQSLSHSAMPVPIDDVPSLDVADWYRRITTVRVRTQIYFHETDQ